MFPATQEVPSELDAVAPAVAPAAHNDVEPPTPSSPGDLSIDLDAEADTATTEVDADADTAPIDDDAPSAAPKAKSKAKARAKSAAPAGAAQMPLPADPPTWGQEFVFPGLGVAPPAKAQAQPKSKAKAQPKGVGANAQAEPKAVGAKSKAGPKRVPAKPKAEPKQTILAAKAKAGPKAAEPKAGSKAGPKAGLPPRPAWPGPLVASAEAEVAENDQRMQTSRLASPVGVAAGMPTPTDAQVPTPTDAPLDVHNYCATDWQCCRCLRTLDSSVKQYLDNGRKHRCPQCNSLRTQAYKDGTWSSVVALTDEQTNDYFQNAVALSKADRLKLIKDYTVINNQASEKIKRKRGQYLPLSVWERMGYDPERIKSDCAPGDIEIRPKLGLCYCVENEVEDEVETQGWRAQDITSRPASSSNRTACSALTNGQDDESAKRLKRDTDLLEKYKAKEMKSLDKVIEPLVGMFGTVSPVLRPSIGAFLSEFDRAKNAALASTSREEVVQVMTQVATTMEQGRTMVRNFKK